MAAHQAPLSLGFSRQEHWSGLPCPSPMHESEKVKVKSLSHVRLFETPWTAADQAPLCPWEFPGKSTGVGAIAFSKRFSLDTRENVQLAGILAAMCTVILPYCRVVWASSEPLAWASRLTSCWGAYLISPYLGIEWWLSVGAYKE